MGLLGKVFGQSERRTELWPPKPGKSTFVDAVPGKVVVEFFAHENVDGFAGNFLSAVSEGLAKRRQRELVFTVRLAAGEDPTDKMREIVRFLVTVYAWASEGNLVDAGGFTQFGQRGLFGRADSGLLYTDARAMDGVRLPEQALAGVSVDAREIRAALDYGVYRVLTRIGLQLRLFPFPTWTDLERSCAVTADEAESRLTQLQRVRAPGVSFVLHGDLLRVSLPNDTTGLLRSLRALAPGVPFALLTRPAPSANAILVWSPGQEGMSGISPDGSDGSRRSGSCLVVVPGGKHADEVRTFEDGCSVSFSTESWGLLSASLAGERPFALPTPSGMRIEIALPPRAALGSPSSSAH
jgi:hypothetical protein